MKADISITKFLEDNERFADFFNGYVFNGNQVIYPDELKNKEVRGVLKAGNEKELKKDRYVYRDILNNQTSLKTAKLPKNIEEK